jgi:hypothetical protein
MNRTLPLFTLGLIAGLDLFTTAAQTELPVGSKVPAAGIHQTVFSEQYSRAKHLLCTRPSLYHRH